MTPKPLASSAPPKDCPACDGAGGHAQDTSRGTVRSSVWDTCGHCRGTGTV